MSWPSPRTCISAAPTLRRPVARRRSAAAFALVALWRIVDPRRETYRMLEWCVIPGAAVIVLWLARLTAFVSGSISGLASDPRPLTLLRLALVLVALAGVWHLTELMQQESDTPRRRLFRIGLVALPLVALAAPPVALALAAPLGTVTLARYVAVQRERPNRGSNDPSTAHRARALPRALCADDGGRGGEGLPAFPAPPASGSYPGCQSSAAPPGGPAHGSSLTAHSNAGRSRPHAVAQAGVERRAARSANPSRGWRPSSARSSPGWRT